MGELPTLYPEDDLELFSNIQSGLISTCFALNRPLLWGRRGFLNERDVCNFGWQLNMPYSGALSNVNNYLNTIFTLSGGIVLFACSFNEISYWAQFKADKTNVSSSESSARELGNDGNPLVSWDIQTFMTYLTMVLPVSVWLIALWMLCLHLHLFLPNCVRQCGKALIIFSG